MSRFSKDGSEISEANLSFITSIVPGGRYFDHIFSLGHVERLRDRGLLSFLQNYSLSNSLR
jgi:hypothetical protein